MDGEEGGNGMNELIPTQQNEDGNILVSGRDLHEFLEVNSNYTTWVNRMVDYGFSENVDYVLLSENGMQKGSGGHNKQDHHIKLDMAKEISMLQRNEKGKQARLYFLDLERKWNSPEMIVQRAMDIQKKKIYELETKIESDKRYTSFGKVVEVSETSINIGAFAKMVYEKSGVNIGRNKLMSWLRNNSYLIKGGHEKNFPKQKYIEQGLFEVKPTIIKRTQGDVQSGTPVITGKGQIKITELLLKEFDAS